MQIDGYTRMAAVVATPIKHSSSPFIHNLAFENTGINGVYVAWDIPQEDLAATIANIKRYDMFGVNISMPYKKEVIQYLDELSPNARLMGAVNTVVNDHGKLVGHNTDMTGFFASIPDFVVTDKTLTILGSGGAASAIITQAALDGAKKIYVFNKSQSLVVTQGRVETIIEATGVSIEVLPIENQALIQEKANEADLFVNATSVGMDGKSCLISPDFFFEPGQLVVDVIYQPFETPFLKLARSKGANATNGLGMLLYQASAAFELWTGTPMPTEEIWPELVKRYQDK